MIDWRVVWGHDARDYRYSWIRDSSFTLYALIRLGFTEEANGAYHFLSVLLLCSGLGPYFQHISSSSLSVWGTRIRMEVCRSCIPFTVSSQIDFWFNDYIFPNQVKSIYLRSSWLIWMDIKARNRSESEMELQIINSLWVYFLFYMSRYWREGISGYLWWIVSLVLQSLDVVLMDGCHGAIFLQDGLHIPWSESELLCHDYLSLNIQWVSSENPLYVLRSFDEGFLPDFCIEIRAMMIGTSTIL